MKNRAKLFAFLTLIVLAVTLPLVYRALTTQRQELRQKAVPATTLSFSPPGIVTTDNGSFSIASQIDPGSNQVSAVELHLKFNPSLVQLTNVASSSAFPVILQSPIIDNTNGTLLLTVGITPLNPVTTVNTVATFNFHALNQDLFSATFSYDTTTQASAYNETGNVIWSMIPSNVAIGPPPPEGCSYEPQSCTNSVPPSCNYILVCQTPKSTPTPSPCDGKQDGDSCQLIDCPYCAPGSLCSKRPCRLLPGTGTCSNNVCLEPTATPTATPTPTPVILNFLLKFTGVTGGNAVGAGVTIRFVNGAINLVTPIIPVSYQGNGIYQASISLNSTQLPPGPGYTIIVKGEKHIARKFCKISGQSQPCTSGDSLTIPATLTNPVVPLDFTGLSLDPGDVPPQDNKADSGDFDRIKALMSKPCSALTDSDLLTGDLNYDGCVNALDAFLMRKTLEIRYDEN